MAVAVVQQARTAGTGTTGTITLASNPTIGNLLLLVVCCNVNVAAITAASGASGAMTMIDGADQGAGSCSIWAIVATVGGPGDKVLQAALGSSVSYTVEGYEISGEDPASLAAATPSHSADGKTIAATATHTSITPTAGLSGVLIAGIQWVGGTTSAQSIDSGLTIHIGSTNRGAAAELTVASASGSYAPKWSWTTSRTSALCQVFVQDAPASGTGFMFWYAARIE